MDVPHKRASNVCTYIKVPPFSCRPFSVPLFWASTISILFPSIVRGRNYAILILFIHVSRWFRAIHLLCPFTVMSSFNFRFDWIDLPSRLRVLGWLEQCLSLTIGFDPESKTDTGHICAKYLLYADLHICKSHPRWHSTFDQADQTALFPVQCPSRLSTMSSFRSIGLHSPK